MFIAQIESVTSQPLLVAIIVITVINLLITFYLLNRISQQNVKPIVEQEVQIERNNNSAPKIVYARSSDMNGEIAAVISTALSLYSDDVHDFENAVLTIKKYAKTYSPWSSKIYGLRKNPR